MAKPYFLDIDGPVLKCSFFFHGIQSILNDFFCHSGMLFHVLPADWITPKCLKNVLGENYGN